MVFVQEKTHIAYIYIYIYIYIYATKVVPNSAQATNA